MATRASQRRKRTSGLPRPQLAGNGPNYSRTYRRAHAEHFEVSTRRSKVAQRATVDLRNETATTTHQPDTERVCVCVSDGPAQPVSASSSVWQFHTQQTYVPLAPNLHKAHSHDFEGTQGPTYAVTWLAMGNGSWRPWLLSLVSKATDMLESF